MSKSLNACLEPRSKPDHTATSRGREGNSLWKLSLSPTSELSFRKQLVATTAGSPGWIAG
jgi:hypothetical protein